MKKFTNTQGSVWVAVLVIIAVVVAALFLSGNFNNLSTSDKQGEDQSVHGLVSEIDQEEQYFLLTEIKVLSVDEDGSADVQETEYTVSWTNSMVIQGYHPSVLNGGEMVRVTPREELQEGKVLIVDPQSIQVTQVAEDESAVEAVTTEVTADEPEVSTTSTDTDN